MNSENYNFEAYDSDKIEPDDSVVTLSSDDLIYENVNLKTSENIKHNYPSLPLLIYRLEQRCQNRSPRVTYGHHKF